MEFAFGIMELHLYRAKTPELILTIRRIFWLEVRLKDTVFVIVNTSNANTETD